MEVYVLVFLTAVVAGALSGIVGTGSSLLLLPVLVHAYGPKGALPIMAMAAIIGNISRVLAWWSRIDWRAVSAYVSTGVPMAALGAHTLLMLPARSVDVALGLFFWCMVPLRRHLHQSKRKISWVLLSACGGGIGFLTGLVLSTGPISVPVFTAYGLSGGGFLGTEAASALLLYISKVSTFAAQSALSKQIILQGLLVGAGIMLGTVASKPMVLKLSPAIFGRWIDAMLVVSGASLLWAAA